MFENIGSKIKICAKVCCWIGIIASVIYGFALGAMDESLGLVGFLVIVFGPLLSWVGSFVTYGFGQLIENTDILVFEKKAKTEAQKQPDGEDKRLETLNRWRDQGLITEEEYLNEVMQL